MMDEAQNLLKSYLREKSEQAFRHLVERHSGLVYTTALRRLNGESAFAHDVMQDVFILLAKKAPTLPPDLCLSGWLYRQTIRLAANHARGERRRRRREQVAQESLMQSQELDDSGLNEELDHALKSLSPKDQDALILRFYEKQSFEVIGKSLGISAEATRKRTTRALESLRALMTKQGTRFATPILIAALTGLGSKPVSAKMLHQVTENAFPHTVTGAGIGMAMIPLLAGLLTSSLVAGTALVARPWFQSGNTEPPSPFNFIDNSKQPPSS